MPKPRKQLISIADTPLQPLLDTTVETYRQRLMGISWFLRELNENIARQANHEDNCTGRYYKRRPAFYLSGPLRGSNLFPTNWWEGRFKSQALLDEAALTF